MGRGDLRKRKTQRFEPYGSANNCLQKTQKTKHYKSANDVSEQGEEKEESIQSGLSEDYKVKGTAVAQWLLLFFGLSLLPADEVVAAFTDEIMSRMPNDDPCRRFADYVVEYYIDDGCDFPPGVWAQRFESDDN